MLRPHEIQGELPGAFYFLAGVGLSLLFFDINIVLLSTLFLSIGDPAACILGLYYPNTPRLIFINRKKNIAGTFGGCGLFSTIFGLIFIYILDINNSY